MATRMESSAALTRHSGLGRERIFFVGMASAILLMMLTGFGNSYYLRALADAPPLPLFIHLHALVFTAWVLFFFVQAMLIATGQPALHRRLGAAGGVLAGVITILGIMTLLRGARSGHNPGGPFPDALAFLVTPLFDILLFAGFVLAGLYWRRRREAHMRLMLLATIGGFLWPAITRLPYVSGQFLPMFSMLALFVVAGPVHDLMSRRRVHPVYLWGGLLILASFPARRAVGMSDAWHRFAQWLIG
jgi:hypothetical protein